MTINGKVIGAVAALALAGCGSPVGLAPAAERPLGVADAGHGGGRMATVDLTHAFAAQALVHRWVKEDVFRYHVTLVEQAPESTAFVAGDPEFRAPGFADAKAGGLAVTLTALQRQARFTGLSAGKRYVAFVVVEGRKHGSTDPLTILNKQAGYEVLGQAFDFTGGQDVEDSQAITATIRLDDVTFDGKGQVAIDGVTPGSYQNTTEPVSGHPVN